MFSRAPAARVARELSVRAEQQLNPKDGGVAELRPNCPITEICRCARARGFYDQMLFVPWDAQLEFKHDKMKTAGTYRTSSIERVRFRDGVDNGGVERNNSFAITNK
jgi:hypothetical protein